MYHYLKRFKFVCPNIYSTGLYQLRFLSQTLPLFFFNEKVEERKRKGKERKGKVRNLDEKVCFCLSGQAWRKFWSGTNEMSKSFQILKRNV